MNMLTTSYFTSLIMNLKRMEQQSVSTIEIVGLFELLFK